MKNMLIEFNPPLLSNPQDRVDILCNLDAIASAAFFLAGDDQMDLKKMVEFDLDSTIEEYDPARVYRESYEELNEIVESYNFFLSENGISKSQIKIVIDEEKTRFLTDSNKYQIFKVVEIQI